MNPVPSPNLSQRAADQLRDGILRGDSVCAQARLAFALAPDARRFQEPWIARDAEICERLCRGDRAGAAHALELYLQESERTVLEAARARALFPPVIPRATPREGIEDEPQ